MMKYVQSKKKGGRPKVVRDYSLPEKRVVPADVKLLYIDFETYSDLKIQDFGAWAYAEHESTEVLFMSYAYDDGEVRVWDGSDEFPVEILQAVANGTVVVAHNIGFEDAIWQKTLDLPSIPADQMIDTMTLALSIAYPAPLDKLGAFLGLPEEVQKMKEGKALIKLFCMPNKGVRLYQEDHPEMWDTFIEYGKQDIVTTRYIYKHIPKPNAIPAFWVEVRHDIEMNRRGVTVDIDLAHKMYKAVEARGSDVNRILAEITEGRVTTVNQTARISKELSRLELPNMQKETVAEALTRKDLTSVERRLLELRKEAGLAATKKYAAFINRTSSDGRLRGFMRLYGAKRTGRYNSQGVQLQNLVRPSMDWSEIRDWIHAVESHTLVPTESVMEVASNLLRPTLVSAPGKIFGITDLSQIEARVLPWLAGDDGTLDVFRTGRDIYKDAAARIYGVSYENVTGEERFMGKTATLALGYGQWTTGFVNFCAKYGAEMDIDTAYDIVTGWRNTHKKIVTYWKTVERAFKHVLRQGGKAEVRGKITIYRNGKDILMRLPSGRHLCYPKAFMKGDDIMFHGDFGAESTYGGKLVENATQAVARDVMIGNLPRIQDAGYNVLFTVHDEAITEFDKDSGTEDTKELDALLAHTPDWAPDLPLEAEGFLSYRYRK